ncbi:MAG: YaaR family protein [Spirochaetes bacterium]|nr:YaaR family protein [Spirochaetota bacterium]
MDKIESAGDSAIFKRSEKKKKGSKTPKAAKNFPSLVQSVKEKQGIRGRDYGNRRSRKDLEELLDMVYEQGAKLKENSDLDNILEYKKAVRDFLNRVVDKMVTLEKRISGVNILKRKQFTLVTVIDKKLESLAAEVLRNQRDQIKILSAVEEINGLLVDLIT